MNDQIHVIIKDETLGFDIGSLLSNPLVSTGMNAVIPGSGLAMPMLSSFLSPQRPTGTTQTQTFKRPTIAPPPQRQVATQTQRTRSTPPPPQRASMTSRSVETIPAPTQAPAQKEGIDKNILLIGGLALAGVTVLVLTNQKRGRK